MINLNGLINVECTSWRHNHFERIAGASSQSRHLFELSEHLLFHVFRDIIATKYHHERCGSNRACFYLSGANRTFWLTHELSYNIKRSLKLFCHCGLVAI